VLVNEPTAIPSDVLLLAIVGRLSVVLQHTPRAVMAAPPSFEISPPHVADVAVILVIAATVIVGADLGASFLQLKINNNNSPVISTG